ncbi:hypothetical protein [Streptomyces microflavus]|uniref:Small secreted domain n=1 Tax=Streptomyces microflavus TaxID=1919 RepID=A0ABV1QEA3_STRMI
MRTALAVTGLALIGALAGSGTASADDGGTPPAQGSFDAGSPFANTLITAPWQVCSASVSADKSDGFGDCDNSNIGIDRGDHSQVTDALSDSAVPPTN